MDDWVAGLTSQLLWAKDIPSAQTALSHFAAQAHVSYYLYGNSRPGLEQPYIDSSYPAEWTAHYFANRYQFIDPVVLEAQRSHLPFSWRHLATRPGGLSPAQQKLFAEAADFGIRDGFTIPFHTAEGCIAVLSYAFSSVAELQEVMGAQAKLKLLAVYYHTAVERLLDVETPEDELSAIERQCLTGIAHGHSLWEISGRIHRPEPDVAGALRSAREKLGTATTAQAIAKAITQGLIAP
ncbi:MAG: autoinducer binding domain-containing protein [Rhodospirillaceae bacterium]|nr:autoinducer binding domain-containing protein [Rhodospirillales bacterium]